MNEPRSGRVYQYFIDRDGDWWCEGWPVEDPDLRDALSAALFDDGDGLALRCEGEVHPVAFEIAPLFVRDVDTRAAGGPDAGLASVTIHLHDGRAEPLRGGTLRVDDRGRLFCDASPARLPALFFRPAFYRLMDHLQEDGGRYFLRIDGRRCYIDSGATSGGSEER